MATASRDEGVRTGAGEETVPAAGVDWRGLGMRAASLAALVALWAAAAGVTDTDLLPGPADVLRRLLAETATGELPEHLGRTLARVGVGFAVAMVLGTALGLAMGRLRRLDALLDGWLILGLNVPALVTSILCFLWIGLNEVGAVAAVVINKVPLVAVILRDSTRALDAELIEVARVYRLPAGRTLARVVVPQLLPGLLSAARTGLALIWKIVLVVELLGRPNGVGFQLGVFFQFFDITGILAYTLAFVLVIFMIEAQVLRPVERRLTRWRPADGR